MDRLMRMSVFVKVVAHNSFVAAAQELGLSPAAVSKRVIALERSLGARLLNRNTRRISLTEVGSVVHQRYNRLLEEFGRGRALRRLAAGQPARRAANRSASVIRHTPSGARDCRLYGALPFRLTWSSMIERSI